MPLPRFLTAALSLLVLLALSPSLTAQERAPLRLATAPPVISEFLANPAAVSDSAGEWIEIYNPSPDPVNLLGWTLADLDSDRHTISADVVIAAGGYVVLARSGDPAANGGVTATYVYAGAIQLANTTDELLLLDPDGAAVDRVLWGDGTELTVPTGASLERTDLGGASKAPRALGAAWAPATVPWPGSAGDLGSPGQPFAGSAPTATPTPSPSPSVTPSSTPTPSFTPTVPGNPTGTSTPTATFSPTESPTVSPTVTPTPTQAPTQTPTSSGSSPNLVISEFLANPAAVADSDGEWIEIHNLGPDPANLQGWALADEGTDRHVIAADRPVAAGAYVILARNGDPAANGGVSADYVIGGGLQLANTADELLLLAPDGTLMQRVAWGDGGLAVTNGASLEWADFGDPSAWATAWAMWPASAGDRGSPGLPYSAPPDASPTPTPTRTPPAHWQPINAPSPLIFDEIYFRSADNEFIVLHNRGDTALDLTGWAVGDAEVPGDGEGMVALPDGAILAPDARFVIARDGAAFRTRWGRPPDAQIQATDPDVPALARRTDLASGSIALNDSGDEVLLLNPGGLLSDAVAYANGDYAALSLSGDLRPPSDAGLHRVDGPDFPAQPDGRHRYLFAPPAPFAPLPPLSASPHTSPALDADLHAIWGTLAARSNFSQNGTAPPGYLLTAAYAQGLDFVALADPISEETGRTGIESQPLLPRQEASVLVDAWGWGDLLGASAVVYAAPAQPDLDQTGLLTHVRDRGVLQWLSADPPADPAVVAIPGDDVAASGGWTALARLWGASGLAWLPAGNSNPTLPGEVDPAPHFSGLAVAQADEAGILHALAARRGWLTNRPGLWLTLRTDAAWMGTVLPPVEQLSDPLTFHIAYGDLAGQPAGMTLWRDDRPLVSLDSPAADGRWSPTVPLAAGVYYMVATQPDGDFAVTAPIIIPSTPPTPVPPPTITPTPGPTRLPANYGQAPGPPGSLAAAKLAGLDAIVRFRAQIIAPPGLYNASIYVAEPVAGSNVGGLGVQIYLRRGDYPALAEGDWVDIQGRLDSFRGELELVLDSPEQIWRMGPGDPLRPLPIQPEEVSESLESRLVTVRGVVTGWGWDSFYLDAGAPDESVTVTVRSSLAWRRPYVNVGEVWEVTGIVSQFATAAPWNDGYRILVRYPSDLVRVGE